MVVAYHFGVVWGWKLVSSLVERWIGNMPSARGGGAGTLNDLTVFWADQK